MTIIHTPTEKEFNELIFFVQKNCPYIDMDNIQYIKYDSYKSKTCIRIFDNKIKYADTTYYREQFPNEPIITVEQFKQQIMKQDTKLEITKEKILEAASKCFQAKETLKVLFPEVFEEDKYFDLNKLDFRTNDLNWKKSGFNDDNPMFIRGAGEFAGKAFYLDPSYNWELVKDSHNILCLVPTKK